jgi:hypothetical protein
LILAGILASAALAGAQTDVTWTNDDGTGLWNTTDDNWSTGAWTNLVDPDNAIFPAAGAGDIRVGEPITVGNMTFQSGGYAIDAASSYLTTDANAQLIVGGLDVYGGFSTASGADAPALTVSGTMAAMGSNGSFHGVEDLITLGYSGSGLAPCILLDNSNGIAGGDPVNADRWGNNADLNLTGDMSAFKLTEAPRADTGYATELTEVVGDLNFSGMAHITIYADTLNPDAVISTQHYQQENLTTLSAKRINRDDNLGGVLCLSGHLIDDNLYGSNASSRQLGDLHRLVLDDAPEMMGNGIAAAYIIDARRDNYLAYDPTRGFHAPEGDWWVGFNGSNDAMADQVAYNQRIYSGGVWVTDPVLTDDRSCLAVISSQALHSQANVGEYTLSITSGGFLAKAGNNSVYCNIRAGTAEATRELVVYANASTSFYGTIEAADMTIANSPGTITADIGIYADNAETLTGRIAIYQNDGRRTYLWHPNALGIGNDLIVGAGTLDLRAEGTYQLGHITVGTGKIDLRDSFLTTTTSPEEVRQMILTGKIMSQNAGPIDGDGPELVMAYKEIDVEGEILIQAGLTVMGDANMDGIVDVSDLGILAGNWEADIDVHWYKGDFNLDGIVDVSDLGILAGNWETDITADELAPMLDVVPEPASMSLLAIGGLTFFRFRRRR